MPDTPSPHPPPHQREIPTRVVSLRAEMDAAPDHIVPLAVLAILVALLGTTCMPLITVVSMLATGQTLLDGAQSGDVLPSTGPASASPAGGPVRQIPTYTLVGVLVFFTIAALGIVGGIATILRREWGRKLLLAYAALVLLYLITAVYLRFRFGIEGLTRTAPTPSALSLNLTCVFGVLLVVSVLMIAILRYFTLPHIARRFR